METGAAKELSVNCLDKFSDFLFGPENKRLIVRICHSRQLTTGNLPEFIRPSSKKMLYQSPAFLINVDLMVPYSNTYSTISPPILRSLRKSSGKFKRFHSLPKLFLDHAAASIQENLSRLLGKPQLHQLGHKELYFVSSDPR